MFYNSFKPDTSSVNQLGNVLTNSTPRTTMAGMAQQCYPGSMSPFGLQSSWSNSISTSTWSTAIPSQMPWAPIVPSGDFMKFAADPTVANVNFLPTPVVVQQPPVTMFNSSPVAGTQPVAAAQQESYFSPPSVIPPTSSLPPQQLPPFGPPQMSSSFGDMSNESCQRRFLKRRAPYDSSWIGSAKQRLTEERMCQRLNQLTLEAAAASSGNSRFDWELEDSLSYTTETNDPAIVLSPEVQRVLAGDKVTTLLQEEANKKITMALVPYTPSPLTKTLESQVTAKALSASKDNTSNNVLLNQEIEDDCVEEMSNGEVMEV